MLYNADLENESLNLSCFIKLSPTQLEVKIRAQKQSLTDQLKYSDRVISIPFQTE